MTSGKRGGKYAFSVPQQRKLLDLYIQTQDSTLSFGVFLDVIKKSLKMKGSSDYQIYWKARRTKL